MCVCRFTISTPSLFVSMSVFYSFSECGHSATAHSLLFNSFSAYFFWFVDVAMDSWKMIEILRFRCCAVADVFCMSLYCYSFLRALFIRHQCSFLLQSTLPHHNNRCSSNSMFLFSLVLYCLFGYYEVFEYVLLFQLSCSIFGLIHFHHLWIFCCISLILFFSLSSSLLSVSSPALSIFDRLTILH